MLGLSEILALAIGLFFVYLLLSAITSYITEAISGRFRLRAKNLEDAIQQLLEPITSTNNPPPKVNIRDNFYKHPIIKSLSKPNSKPSYISARDFSMTLLDLLIESQPSQPKDSEQYPEKYSEQYLAALKDSINGFEGDLKRSLQLLIRDAEVTEPDPVKRIAQVRQNIDNWYTTTMERATGWYKKRVQVINIIVGFLVACALNADTINIAQTLWENSGSRQEAVQAAGMALQKATEEASQKATNEPPKQEVSVEEIVEQLNDVNFPLGWAGQNENLSTPFGWLSKIMGLLITALAISVGSSIWFDILNRVINLRSTGVKL